MTNKQLIEELFDRIDAAAEAKAEQQLNNETVAEGQQDAEPTAPSIKAKAKIVLEDVLDSLILGGYVIESGEELLKTMQAVAMYQHLD